MTDLSLKNKSQTPHTSVGTSIEGSLGAVSSNESGKNLDGGSPSENSGTEGKDSAGDDSKASSSPSPLPVDLGYLPVEKLSMANMKKHDKELALMNPPSRHAKRMTKLDSLPESLEDISVLKLHAKKKKKREGSQYKLPKISSSLDRSFPLPNPRQIELYSQEDEKVDLDSRPLSAQNSSKSVEGTESSTSSISDSNS